MLAVVRIQAWCESDLCEKWLYWERSPPKAKETTEWTRKKWTRYKKRVLHEEKEKEKLSYQTLPVTLPPTFSYLFRTEAAWMGDQGCHWPVSALHLTSLHSSS